MDRSELRKRSGVYERRECRIIWKWGRGEPRESVRSDGRDKERVAGETVTSLENVTNPELHLSYSELLTSQSLNSIGTDCEDAISISVQRIGLHFTKVQFSLHLTGGVV